MIRPYHEVPDITTLMADLEKSDHKFVFILQIDDYVNFNIHVDNRSAQILQKAIYLRLVDVNKDRFDLYTNGGSRFFFTSKEDLPKEEVIRSFSVFQNCASYEEIDLDGEKLSVSTTVGFAYNRLQLFESARIALERARDRGVPYHEFVDEDMNRENYIDNAKWNYKLMRGFWSKKVIPWFQPIMNLETSQIERFEALARYVAPNGDVFSAAEFLPKVRDSRLVHQLSRVIFKRTLENYGDSDFGFSINVGATDIENGLTVNSIYETIKSFKNPSHLVLELIETD